ncbi:MAG: RdgB/HAM1 family non-canonical purine NTP pyrophosphatase [Calditrichaceae bacterium]
MFRLIAGTTNQHKIHEIRRILDLDGLTISSLNEFENFPDVNENGLTFHENAAIKARAYFEYFRTPVFADDSGLVVPALSGEPGIYSARYSGPDASYESNNQLLIEKIRQIPEKYRNAQFVCTICYKDEKNEIFFTGTTDGIILDELTGVEGFGYDPLFYIPGLKKTYAQIDTDEKNRISHRGKAIGQLKEFFIKNMTL